LDITDTSNSYEILRFFYVSLSHCYYLGYDCDYCDYCDY